jgi:hypothetical protein
METRHETLGCQNGVRLDELLCLVRSSSIQCLWKLDLSCNSVTSCGIAALLPLAGPCTLKVLSLVCRDLNDTELLKSGGLNHKRFFRGLLM